MDIKVKFKTGGVVKATYQHFKNGYVKNPLCANIHGIGYIGIGKHKPSINRKNTIEYEIWHSMLKRCYDPYIINKQLTYQNAIVCKSWHNFQNFAEWCKENYYEIPNERTELDKDIIKKSNKIYSPEYCSFVPKSINCLLTKSNNARGCCPIGVCFDKNKYKSQINIDGKRKHLGYFSAPIDAFGVYKKAKEKYIKVMANKYKNVLNINVYNSLIKYNVEITD